MNKAHYPKEKIPAPKRKKMEPSEYDLAVLLIARTVICLCVIAMIVGIVL